MRRFISFYLRIKHKLHVDFILAPLISTISHLMGHSKIKSFDESFQSLSSYTAIVGQPSTGKTIALDLIKSAFVDIELYYQVEASRSEVSNTPTVESLLELLSKVTTSIGNIFNISYYFYCSQ